MAKVLEKAEARQLRAEGGSVKAIARILNVAPSSVSVWTRDVALPLCTRQPDKAIAAKRGKSIAAAWLNRRQTYQLMGREKMKALDPLFVAGCMLYWGEGAKSRNACKLVNSDPDMIRLFIRFLRETLDVISEDITICINCYTNNGLSLGDIEQYWLNYLGLPVTSLRKSVVNNLPKSSKGGGVGKLPYGVCALTVCKTEVVQQILGAIQEFGKCNLGEWASK